MNDLTSSTPSVAPAGSSAPASSPEPHRDSGSTSTTSGADWNKLAKPDRPEAFGEHLLEQMGHSQDSGSGSDDSDETDSVDEQRRGTTRNERRERRAELRGELKLQQRLQAAAQQERAEAAESRAPDEPEGEGGDEAAPEAAQYDDDPEEMQRQQQALHEVRQQMRRELDIAADHRANERRFAAQHPDYYKVVETAVGYDLPEHNAALIRESPYSAKLAYELAGTENGREVLAKLCHMSPVEAAKIIGRAEARMEAEQRQQRAPAAQSQRRVHTKASPPLSVLKGGAGGGRSLSEQAGGPGMRVPTHFAESIVRATRGNR